MPKEFSQDIIDQYLSKQLEGQALSEFQAKLESDVEFKKEVETQAFLHRGVNKFGEDEMRAKLKKIRAEVLAPAAKVVPLGGKKKTRPILRWSLAATVALALGAAIYLIATWENVSATDLYASYYEPFGETVNVRNASATDIANQASQLYKTKNYEEALPLFQEVLEAEPTNAEVQIAIGICQLELGRLEKATQSFSAVNNALYKDQAQWFLAMTFLKQSDIENAAIVLASIKEGDFNYTKAQQILAEIK